jgi:hypothetical protein
MADYVGTPCAEAATWSKDDAIRTTSWLLEGLDNRWRHAHASAYGITPARPCPPPRRRSQPRARGHRSPSARRCTRTRAGPNDRDDSGEPEPPPSGGAA